MIKYNALQNPTSFFILYGLINFIKTFNQCKFLRNLNFVNYSLTIGGTNLHNKICNPKGIFKNLQPPDILILHSKQRHVFYPSSIKIFKGSTITRQLLEV